jgi:zinc transport system ATP-binding protein
VRTALEQVGLWERRNDRLDTLSGGQQRRVLIASALAKGATVFILDEPTAGVDAENQELIAETFRMIRDQGGTVILVTHELGTFTDLATRVVILDHGRVSYDGAAPGPKRAHDHGVHHSEDLRPAEPPSTLFGTAGGDAQ